MTRNLTIATAFMLAATLLLGYIWVRENSVLAARSERFTGALEARGARDYEQYCASCHGLTGEGGVRNGAPRKRLKKPRADGSIQCSRWCLDIA